jgi:hypothetical protein
MKKMKKILGKKEGPIKIYNVKHANNLSQQNNKFDYKRKRKEKKWIRRQVEFQLKQFDLKNRIITIGLHGKRKI